MNIVFKENNQNRFNSLWNNFIKINKVDFNYSLEILDFFILNSNSLFSDKSFVLEENNQCVGICFLPIEEINSIKKISISNTYIVSPLGKNEKYEKQIFRIIKEISIKENVKEVKIYLSRFVNNEFNKLLKYDFKDDSITTCYIDLKNDYKILWQNLRKSYKSLINYLLKDESFKIIYSGKDNYERLHEKYVEFHTIHMRKALKKPRNIEIYNKQKELIKKEFASIIAIEYKAQIVMTNYYFHDLENVTYSSSSYDLNFEYKDLALNHYLIHESILYFKNKGYHIINFGEPCGFRIDGLNDKELSISSFKLGMGAFPKTLYRGRYFVENSNNIFNYMELSKSLQSLAFWYAYEQSKFTEYNIPELAIQNELTTLLYSEFHSKYFIQSEVSLKKICNIDNTSRIDILIKDKKSNEAIAALEIKKVSNILNKELEKDFTKLKKIKNELPHIYTAVIVCSSKKLPNNWLSITGKANRRKFKLKDNYYKIKRIFRSTKNITLKSIINNSFYIVILE